MGDEITYTPNAGSPLAIKGVFDNAAVAVEGVISIRPIVRIVLSDLESEPLRGDQVTINSTDYTVSEVEPDSFGGATLILKKA